MRRVSANTQVEIGLFTTLLNQTFQGARHVKAYGMEAYETNAAPARCSSACSSCVDRANRTRARRLAGDGGAGRRRRSPW